MTGGRKIRWLSILAAAWIYFLQVENSFAQAPLMHGVNLTNWFQNGSAHEIQFSKYTKQDLINIKSLGCDLIRLPINLNNMTSGEPDYTLDPLFLSFLDSAVTWAEDLNLHLILDNHTFDPAASTSPEIGPVLVKVWTQMAAHYKNRSDLIMYEVLNEPHGIDESTWNNIQQTVIDAIRTEDTRHTIVVGPANWNSYNSLSGMPVYSDDNLIYTFHFYDPFVFTHQGATWTDPSMASLAGVPFPYDASRMPAVPAELQGTWIASNLNNYPNDGTVAKVKQLLDIAVNFKNSRHVPVLCGEFGVYNLNSNNDDRVEWYRVVRQYLEEKGISWTTWDYQNGFGLFEKGSNELFDYDLNVPLLEALNMNVPDQSMFYIGPLTSGFTIFDDFLGPRIFNATYTSTESLDYYLKDNAQSGTYCIGWDNAPRYASIALDFTPNVDLSLLAVNDFVVRFWVRGNATGKSLDVRFIDSDTADPSDHPWRMGKIIPPSELVWDGAWHQITVPLSEMSEEGSYEGTYYSAQGLFDWHNVDQFAIVAEEQSLEGTSVAFDNIEVTGTPVVTGINEQSATERLTVYPNPFSSMTTIQFSVEHPGATDISIISTTGKRIRTIEAGYLEPGVHALSWDGDNDQGVPVADGVYLCRVSSGNHVETTKIIRTH